MQRISAFVYQEEIVDVWLLAGKSFYQKSRKNLKNTCINNEYTVKC